ncbi:MAG: TolC family protein [Planctomycetaceae bacterium]
MFTLLMTGLVAADSCAQGTPVYQSVVLNGTQPQQHGQPVWLPRLRQVKQGRRLQHNSTRSDAAVAHSAVAQQSADSRKRQIVPWWHGEVTRSVRHGVPRRDINLDSIILTALACSEEVRSVNLIAPIQHTAIGEEVAEFDWTAFLDQDYDDTSVPVRGPLTAGPGVTRFRDNRLVGRAGVRRRVQSGGQLEAFHEIGYQDNNSTFLDPTQQATSQLELSFTQPLLNGSGVAYNQSRIVLAALNTRQAEAESVGKLQDHLLAVSDAYWNLYRNRCRYLQRQKHLAKAKKLLRLLQSRKQLDIRELQIARGTSVVAERGAVLIRVDADLRNSQAQLRGLVNDPGWPPGLVEVIPNEPSHVSDISPNAASAFQLMMTNSPEIRGASEAVQAASTRAHVADHELMPKLDLLLRTYVTGLRGSTEFGQAWVAQFNEGEPSYAIGLRFEVPLGRRAAVSRRTRRVLELNQAMHQLQALIHRTAAEVEVAIRNIETSLKEVERRQVAMDALQKQIEALSARWEAPGQDISLLITQLLDAQDFLVRQEETLVMARVDNQRSWSQFKRITGTLMCRTPVRSGPATFRGQDAESGETVQARRVAANAVADAPTRHIMTADKPSRRPAGFLRKTGLRFRSLFAGFRRE